MMADANDPNPVESDATETSVSDESWRTDESKRMRKIREKRKTKVPDPKVALRGTLSRRRS